MLKQDIKTTKETDVKYIKKVATASEKPLSASSKDQTQALAEERPPRGPCPPVAG